MDACSYSDLNFDPLCGPSPSKLTKQAEGAVWIWFAGQAKDKSTRCSSDGEKKRSESEGDKGSIQHRGTQKEGNGGVFCHGYQYHFPSPFLYASLALPSLTLLQPFHACSSPHHSSYASSSLPCCVCTRGKSECRSAVTSTHSRTQGCVCLPPSLVLCTLCTLILTVRVPYPAQGHLAACVLD